MELGNWQKCHQIPSITLQAEVFVPDQNSAVGRVGKLSHRRGATRTNLQVQGRHRLVPSLPLVPWFDLRIARDLPTTGFIFAFPSCGKRSGDRGYMKMAEVGWNSYGVTRSSSHPWCKEAVTSSLLYRSQIRWPELSIWGPEVSQGDAWHPEGHFQHPPTSTSLCQANWPSLSAVLLVTF